MLKKIFLRTFGCQMNEADSQEMLAALLARGYAPADTLREADAVLVNTCTVRAHAEHRAVSYIGRLAKWKNDSDRDRTVIVAGCAAERLGKKLKNQFPHIDIVAGAKSITRFPQLLDRAGLAQTDAGAPPPCGLCAFVTVMRGCDCRCAYCIVPSVRGPASFRSPEEIEKEVRAKVAAGAREITLLGQTVNSYHAHGCPDFAALLTRLHAVEGLARLRFMSPHPAFINDSLIEAYRTLPGLAKYLHLPVQSGSDRVLALMRRGYTREQFLAKVAKLRAAVPEIAISTDFIVGFPSETREDFEDSLSLARQAGISAAYCFKFSPREGTAAWDMPQVPQAEVEDRLGRLLETVRDLSVSSLDTLSGRTVEVLMESDRSGRTSQNFWAEVSGGAKRGELVRARVTEVRERAVAAKLLSRGNEHD